MRTATARPGLVRRSVLAGCAIWLTLGLAGCREQTAPAAVPEAADKEVSAKVAAPEPTPEIVLPDQVTRRLTPEQMPTALSQAVEERDILLLDRIAWCAEDEDLRTKAEQAMTALIEGRQAELIARVEDEKATFAATSGIALGSDIVGLGTMSTDPLSCEAEIKETPADAIEVIIQKVNLTRDSSAPAFLPSMSTTPGADFPQPTRTTADVDYAVVVGEGVEAGEHRLAFDIVFKSTIERVAHPVALTLNIQNGRFTRDDAVLVYAALSSLKREHGRILIQGLRGSEDLPLSALEGLLAKSEEINRRTLLWATLLRDLRTNGDREVAMAADQCWRLVDGKWDEWQGSSPDP